MVWSKTRQALLDGELVVGYFGPAGTDIETPGILRWSPDNGAQLELIGDARGWPLDASQHFVAHGTSDSGDEFTLPNAWPKRVSLLEHVRDVRASTLFLGEHVDNSARWPRAIYSTVSLPEWRAQTGLQFSFPNRRKRPQHFRYDWQPPERAEVNLAHGQLAFVGDVSTSHGFAPSWSIETTQKVVVNVDRALTVDEHYRAYAEPLQALIAFASDRPNSLTWEVMFDPSSKRRIEVWRSAPVIRAREWRRDRGFLFRAAELDDRPDAIRNWWSLHDEVWPALGLFGEHVREHLSYSPARFLTLYTALEAYSRVRHGHKNFRKLREFAGVPNDVTGCTKDALALVGVTRNYFAHLGHTGQKYTLDDVQDNMLASTRRVSALMQACLLRELAFSPSKTEALLRAHYANWPMP